MPTAIPANPADGSTTLALRAGRRQASDHRGLGLVHGVPSTRRLCACWVFPALPSLCFALEGADERSAASPSS
jgi:hypothetical protein